MNIVALYCVSGTARWLPYSYKSVYPAVNAVYFLLSNKTYHGKSAGNSKLLGQLAELPDPEQKARLIQGDWAQEVDQRNVSLAYAQLDGFSHALIVDADEIYHSHQLLAGFEYIRLKPEVGCFHVKSFTYWKSLKWRIDPVEPHDPAIVIKVGAGGFVETRNPLTSLHELIPPEIVMCHHLSYVLNDQELRQKHIFEPGHSQTCRPDWFENVWKRWDLDHNIENLHPVNGEWFKRAVEQPASLLPEVLI